MFSPRNSRNKGHTGSTRFVDMELFEGSSFNNYYWMEGPFPGDQGRRVLVLHSGQAQQCSNCLKIGPNCPAAGNGKLCKDEMNTPRAKMSVYMNSLKISKNYTSLKNQYLEAQCKKFPLVSGDIVPPSSASDMDNLDTVQSDILPSNPRAELDSKIKALQESLTKAQESAQNKDEQIAQLEEQLKEAPKSFNEAEVKKLKRDLSTARRKVDKIYDGSANRLLCAITNVETPLNVHDEGFKSACSLFANSSFDPSLTEEEIDKMNSEDKDKLIRMSSNLSGTTSTSLMLSNPSALAEPGTKLLNFSRLQPTRGETLCAEAPPASEGSGRRRITSSLPRWSMTNLPPRRTLSRNPGFPPTIQINKIVCQMLSINLSKLVI